MFFFYSLTWIFAIYLAAALLPAVFLMRYIYKQDRIDKEPPQLLWKCVGSGVLAAFLSMFLEKAGSALLNIARIDQNTVEYTVIFAFLVVACVEEGTKYLLMSRQTWWSPDFNYRFDAIVYAAFTSLGFAALENVLYVFNYGLSVALPRAILSIPGHFGFAVVFGYFYGRARLHRDQGERGKSKASIVVGYLAAVFLHGFYDSCAMIGSGLATGLFIAFVIVMYIFIIHLIRRESWTDAPV